MINENMINENIIETRENNMIEYFDQIQNKIFPYSDNLTDDEQEEENNIIREKNNYNEYFNKLRTGEITIENYLPDWDSEDEFIEDLDDQEHPEKYLKFIREEEMIFNAKYASIYDDDIENNNGEDDDEYNYDEYDEDYVGDMDEQDYILLKKSRQFASK